jgi:predicted transposase/invertase (TIGR01784 family)
MFLDPKNDLVFKRLFGDENHKDRLISFLNNILKLRDDKQIADVHVLNPNQVPRLPELKDTTLDVRCKDQRGIEYIVEMQVAKLKGFDKRVLYYSSKAYVNQIKKNDDYPQLDQVIFVGILGFSFLETKEYVSDHLILDAKTGEHAIKDFRFCFIELPKFTKQEHELQTLDDKWIFFLKNAENLTVIPSTCTEKEIVDAYNMLEEGCWTPEERDLYERIAISRQDQIGRMEQAHIDGVHEGIQKGIQQGKEQGAMEERKAMAQKLRATGMSPQSIADITGLPINECS